MQYEIKKRVVIFGGHDSWLKAIRPMLHGRIKFIGRECRWSNELIQNVDEVWVQPNALAHKQFYKVINKARGYKVPVYYFSSASAAKCAAELANKKSE